MTGSPLRATIRLAEILAQVSVPYVVVGSVASSLLGMPRATADADMVADLTSDRVPALVRLLEEEFYVDEGAVREALRRTSMFNVVHLATGFKVDIYIAGEQPYQQTRLARKLAVQVFEGGEAPVFVATPEDVVLGKLAWFRLGRELSARQWTDVLGILRVQGARLDQAYLERWAEVLGIEDLLQRAMAETDPTPPPP